MWEWCAPGLAFGWEGMGKAVTCITWHTLSIAWSDYRFPAQSGMNAHAPIDRVSVDTQWQAVQSCLIPECCVVKGSTDIKDFLMNWPKCSRVTVAVCGNLVSLCVSVVNLRHPFSWLSWYNYDFFHFGMINHHHDHSMLIVIFNVCENQIHPSVNRKCLFRSHVFLRLKLRWPS